MCKCNKLTKNIYFQNNKQEEGQQMDESLGETIRLGTLLMLLSVPGLMSANDIKTRLPSSNITSQNVIKALDDIQNEQKVYNGYTTLQISNILARTLYMEARNQGEIGIDAVASVILNRAGGEIKNFPSVCLKKSQFSCWNKIKNKDAKHYTITIPISVLRKNNKDSEMWTYCQFVAGQMLNNEFKSTIGLRNSYHTTSVNPDWSSSMKNVVVIGKHKFGYLPEHNGYSKKKKDINKKPNSKIIAYKIKKGDVLGKIALDHNVTIKEILELNKHLIKNQNKIKVGEVIYIPS